jgi:hypothetical protein
MLPNGDFVSILFPMTADLYYSENEQNDLGEMTKTWTKDRTINCSAITALSDKTLSPELKPSEFLTLSNNLYLRTDADVRIELPDQQDESPTIHPLTEILITNILDSNGNNSYPDVLGTTKFEVVTVVPSFNEFQSKNYFRVYVQRSQNQNVELY